MAKQTSSFESLFSFIMATCIPLDPNSITLVFKLLFTAFSDDICY